MLFDPKIFDPKVFDTGEISALLNVTEEQDQIEIVGLSEIDCSLSVTEEPDQVLFVMKAEEKEGSFIPFMQKPIIQGQIYLMENPDRIEFKMEKSRRLTKEEEELLLLLLVA